MNNQLVIGISRCLTGSAIRFDGGHKRMGFVMDKLAQWMTFGPICPEMSIGSPVPCPASRLVQTTQGNVRIYSSHAPDENVTDKMSNFASSHLQGPGGFSGFIVYAKSPNCGTERVRLYDEEGNHGRKEGAGLFTGALMETYPWLPVEEGGHLHDSVLRGNFVERVFALHKLNRLWTSGFTHHSLLSLHSRYKLQLLTHHQTDHRGVGPFVTLLHQWDDLGAFSVIYREKLMTILKKSTSRKNHTNILMHIQGYFCKRLNTRQCGELHDITLNYSGGLLPILALLMLLEHYLAEYPDNYLLTQNYFDPYPDDLVLQLMIK